LTNCELVQAAMMALESDDPRRAADYLSEDFGWVGTFPHPLDKQRFIQMIMAIKKAFPNYTFNINRCEEIQKGVCRATMEPLATHLGVLALPGISPIRPTGISVALELLEALGIEITEEMIGRMFR
jgi:hypothetical protein